MMTFERPEVLELTLKKLLSQTFPPEFILVVDNSFSKETGKLVEGMADGRIGYYSMGYNSGPAGAAKYGLQKLSQMGFEWIYWGDDDNPPSDPGIFRKSFEGIEEIKKSGKVPGIFGGKGGYLNKYTGRLRSLANYELERARFQEVDSVPGGHTLLVNSSVIKQGVLPNEELFFGFEELDFCLRAKEKGFKIYIDAESWHQIRVKANNNQPNYQWRDSAFGRPEFLWREYYSSRNLLVILFSQKYFTAFIYRFLVLGFKSILGFKFGWKYGSENFKIQFKAVLDFIFKRFPRHSLS